MAKEYSLLQALRKVELDARQQAVYHKKEIGSKPFGGSWTQEKHDQYHTENMLEAEATAKWCFVRQMQIDPD